MKGLIRRSDVKEYFKRVIFGADKKIDAWVDSIPAADVVEVVHAYWKNNHKSRTTPFKDGYNCSACGEPTTTAYNRAVRSRWCPWCGARMDGRRKDGDEHGEQE